MANEDQQTQLSQRVEAQVRQLLGELQMQAIVLRQMLEMATGQSQQQPGQQPQPGQPQQPFPPSPTPPSPTPTDPTPHPAARPNGGARPLREV